MQCICSLFDICTRPHRWFIVQMKIVLVKSILIPVTGDTWCLKMLLVHPLSFLPVALYIYINAIHMFLIWFMHSSSSLIHSSNEDRSCKEHSYCCCWRHVVFEDSLGASFEFPSSCSLYSHKCNTSVRSSDFSTCPNHWSIVQMITTLVENVS